ncbi:fcc966a8-2976-4e3a-a14b-10838a309772 [Sclerotinia trifoliorum]|uniref:DSC E3 ubiquitin ligase complex subunit A n=1 Tax=Sclerotinia trifoliorum TaxID=28548 RepID=A0A8H2VU31_9HELO|nr:fcc966a8-2976-4e3a-a14b-10838a309772 [Sclerotinia trifoliorum]
MPPQRGDLSVLLLVIIVLWWFNSNDTSLPSDFGNPRKYVEEQLAHNRHVFGVLNTTSYGDFAPRNSEDARYLNLTGFKAKDGYRWERLDAFRKRSDELRKWARGVQNESKFNGEGERGLEGRIYTNVTGVVRGGWARYMDGLVEGKERTSRLNLSVIAPGVQWAFKDQELWGKNVTGMEGKVMLTLDEVAVEDMIVHGAKENFSEGESSADAGEETPKEEAKVEKRDISDGIERVDLGIGATSNTGILVREVKASLTVQDESSSGDGYEMRMHGVHWPNEGGVLLTTTSDKFAGAFALPHFTTDEDHFKSSAEVMKKILGARLQKLEESAKENPRSLLEQNSGQIDGLPTPHCEYILFAQVQPLKFNGLEYEDRSPKSQKFVQELEEELRFPTGAPTPKPPKLQLSTIIFSPDCGFMLESKGPPKFAPLDGEHLVGMKQEVWLESIRSWLTILAVVALCQALILKDQCKEASTPSTVGRVSIHTVGMMLLADGLLFFTMSLTSAILSSIFPSALLSSFAGLMSVALGVRFMVNIYGVQEPERLERERAQTAVSQAPQARNSPPTGRSAPVITATGVDTLPTTAASSAQNASQNISQNVPIIVPSDQDVDAEIAENINATFVPPRATGAQATVQESRVTSDITPYYGQFILLLTFILLLSIASVTWPVSLRTAYVYLLSFIYMSLWIPQIKRNITRNCRKALLWRFVIAQSLLRLSPFAYFFLYEDNFMFSETDWTGMMILAGWVWCQLVLLYSQEVLGPRWAIPKRFGWYKEGWDYHPVLREDNVESGGLPIGLVKVPLNSPTTSGFEETDMSTESERDNTKSGIRTVDCAICMQILEVPVVGHGEDEGVSKGVMGAWDRRSYMVTPCRHVFHTQCLVGWMKYRLQCPICREGLPPL